MTVPYSDEDFLLPDTMVVAKIPSIVFLVPRVGIIATMSARLFQQAFRTEPKNRSEAHHEIRLSTKENLKIIGEFLGRKKKNVYLCG